MVREAVSWLIEFLGLTPEKVISPLGFNARLRVQKAALLLKHLGVKPFNGFEYGLYLRGPYSTDLSAVYYNIGNTSPLEPSIDEETKRILRWFASNDLTWLEVASSILSIKESHPEISNSDVLLQLQLSKPWVSSLHFTKVLSDLKYKGLVS
jgi:uncharacterized protein YwgA